MIRKAIVAVLLGVGAALCSGCIDTGQQAVVIPFFVAGSDVSDPVITTGEIPVMIERADLAFGPLYLCAGATAGDLCDIARLEWLSTIVIDTTDPRPKEAGQLVGVTGAALSWMYDLSISSQLTRSDPYILDAAHQLGDVSFVLEGRAQVGTVEIAFSAQIPIQQSDTTELGVPVIRKSGEDRFSHEITGDELSLTLRFDPKAWVSTLDLRPYLPSDSDDDLGEGCQLGQSCRTELIFPPDSEAYRSLLIALSTAGRPSFEWGESIYELTKR